MNLAVAFGVYRFASRSKLLTGQHDSSLGRCAYWSIGGTAQLNLMLRIGQVCPSLTMASVPFTNIWMVICSARKISRLRGSFIDGKRKKAKSSGSDRNCHVFGHGTISFIAVLPPIRDMTTLDSRSGTGGGGWMSGRQNHRSDIDRLAFQSQRKPRAEKN